MCIVQSVSLPSLSLSVCLHCSFESDFFLQNYCYVNFSFTWISVCVFLFGYKLVEKELSQVRQELSISESKLQQERSDISVLQSSLESLKETHNHSLEELHRWKREARLVGDELQRRNEEYADLVEQSAGDRTVLEIREGELECVRNDLLLRENEISSLRSQLDSLRSEYDECKVSLRAERGSSDSDRQHLSSLVVSHEHDIHTLESTLESERNEVRLCVYEFVSCSWTFAIDSLHYSFGFIFLPLGLL